MNHAFEEVFDIPKLTELCERYTKTNGVVTALLDLEGNVHVKTGWQDICTRFHRVNEVSAKRCTESDTCLAGQLAAGSNYNVYHCKNGLVDIAVPIHVDGEHVANFFTGQFFFEAPNEDYFRKQGEELGFELIPYMDALSRVPVFKEEDIRKIVEFLSGLAQVFGEMAKAKLDLMELREAEQKQFEELREAKEQMERLAIEDPLTGLKNRREFSARLESEFHRAGRYQHPMSLVIIDVDNFKEINDTHGHAAGDEVLKAVSRLLLGSVRQSDLVARIGGDEFCILCPESSADDVEGLMERVCREISELEFCVHGNAFRVTCSFGLAGYVGLCRNPDELLVCADKSLYEAKQRGRNCVVKYLCKESENLELKVLMGQGRG
ncbi:diguanylate cyclase [Mangrovimicrobium sediminis]|uniref:diguanylate cyclase n=1 Tax=Mangrovimicrobium sediminis TaxID=2562682 RepID=A0A4Z0LVF5_9GAMM|nr:diguanylate cyclase [Haliea sp. SAOS-164]TGD71096.1 diguanylate cyclase [Haliea sp. SAOS-164]